MRGPGVKGIGAMALVWQMGRPLAYLPIPIPRLPVSRLPASGLPVSRSPFRVSRSCDRLSVSSPTTSGPGSGSGSGPGSGFTISDSTNSCPVIPTSRFRSPQHQTLTEVSDLISTILAFIPILTELRAVICLLSGNFSQNVGNNVAEFR